MSMHVGWWMTFVLADVLMLSARQGTAAEAGLVALLLVVVAGAREVRRWADRGRLSVVLLVGWVGVAVVLGTLRGFSPLVGALLGVPSVLVVLGLVRRGPRRVP